MIPFFALVTPDHELPPVWFPTNTIKFIPIPTFIFEAPLLLVKQSQKRMKRDYDVKVRVKELKLGDLVYQLDTATVKGKTRKLSPSWKGPGVVIVLCPMGIVAFPSFPKPCYYPHRVSNASPTILLLPGDACGNPSREALETLWG
jgi:hypothetical protein